MDNIFKLKCLNGQQKVSIWALLGSLILIAAYYLPYTECLHAVLLSFIYPKNKKIDTSFPKLCNEGLHEDPRFEQMHPYVVKLRIWKKHTGRAGITKLL